MLSKRTLIGIYKPLLGKPVIIKVVAAKGLNANGLFLFFFNVKNVELLPLCFLTSHGALLEKI